MFIFAEGCKRIAKYLVEDVNIFMSFEGLVFQAAALLTVIKDKHLRSVHNDLCVCDKSRFALNCKNIYAVRLPAFPLNVLCVKLYFF